MIAAPPVHPDRVRPLNDVPAAAGPVVYWMSRDHRADDNWALLHARHRAAATRQPLAVVFTLAPGFLGAPWRPYAFMLAGLREVERSLRAHGIPLVVLATPEPAAALAAFAAAHGVGQVVVDYSPLSLARAWRADAAHRLAALGVALDEVDAHNCVPCWAASTRREYAARTLRPKLERVLDAYLEPFPPVAPQDRPWPAPLPDVDWAAAEASLSVDRTIGPVEGVVPGPAAGRAALDAFVGRRLTGYATRRNDPNAEAQSGLSPYLHFGQLAPARAAQAVRDAAVAGDPDAAAFFEELVIRRELADNFCHHEPAYDRFDGFPAWARATLDAHRADARDALYDAETFERGATHDALWNACQTQLVATGRLHGYLRMVWAKSILAWSASPEEALATAIRLNDRFQLDGRDPNGYAGIAWSIGGVHDRPWFERPVFGLVRAMTTAGAARRFDAAAYIGRWAAVWRP